MLSILLKINPFFSTANSGGGAQSLESICKNKNVNDCINGKPEGAQERNEIKVMAAQTNQSVSAVVFLRHLCFYMLYIPNLKQEMK